MTQQQLLNVFQLEPGASWSDVRNAYRRLMKSWHPDKHQGDKAAQERAENFSKHLNHCFDLLETLYKNGANAVGSGAEADTRRQEDIYSEYCRQYSASQEYFSNRGAQHSDTPRTFFDYVEIALLSLGLAIVLFAPILLGILTYLSPTGSCLYQVSQMMDQLGLSSTFYAANTAVHSACSYVSFTVIEPVRHWLMYI